MASPITAIIARCLRAYNFLQGAIEIMDDHTTEMIDAFGEIDPDDPLFPEYDDAVRHLWTVRTATTVVMIEVQRDHMRMAMVAALPYFLQLALLNVLVLFEEFVRPILVWLGTTRRWAK
jgi:hypothetical protein